MQEVRLIDANAFAALYGNYYAEQGPAEGFIGTVGDLIAKQPTVEAEHVRNGKGCEYCKGRSYTNEPQMWIPCAERMPEKDKSYITYAETTKYCNHNEIPEELRINVLYFNGEEWYDEQCIFYNVTHWMPLPEPPKGSFD